MSSPANDSSELKERGPTKSGDENMGREISTPQWKSHKRREYKTYNYDALPRGRGIIRLLNLYSSENSDAGILCELITPTEDEKSSYPYEALSWCWGTAPKTDYIRIQRNRKTYAKYVSHNLVAALKALRHPDRSRYIWVDMVCIDQENLNEKNHQVEMMDIIYGNAERVCIWLGEANDSSRTALRFIKNEVSHLQSFDTLCDSKDASKKWVALLDLMQRPWFSRRWVVQELALAQKAVIYCGHDRISWNKFAIAVELLVEVETATHRLSEVMKKDRQYQYIPSYFEFVSALGASLLVDANERLFRESKETKPPETGSVSRLDPDLDSDSDDSPEAIDSDDSETSTVPPPRAMRHAPRIQPLLSLEYLVSSLTIFETSMPHDTIYALLAIAKDTTPRAVDPQDAGGSGRAHEGLEIYTQRKSYNVDYKLPYVDVCKEFILFSIERSSHTDRSRALDVICRPWAVEERKLRKIRENKQQTKVKRERDERRERDRKQRRTSRSQHKASAVTPTDKPGVPAPINTDDSESSTNHKYVEIEDMALPSWVPQLSGAPYAMTHRPGHAGPKMSRINADHLVGLPSLTQRNYSAAETKGVDLKALRFRKRPTLGHYSMYVRGFVLDQIQDVEQVARNGGIPREWADLEHWENAKGHPPDAFWRTLVANRGKEGKNPPVYYSRACEESFKKGGLESGAVDTTALIEYERNSVVAQFCRRVQAVTWNRALVKTEGGRLGLVRKDVEKGDQVCILYGCSVPVILRQSDRKDEKVFTEELEQELIYLKNTMVQSFKRYFKLKKRHQQQKGIGKKQLCKQWFKQSDWIRTNGFTSRQLSNEETREELKRILRNAARDFDTWRFKKRAKVWPEQLRKMEQEMRDAKTVRSRPGKKQMDELLKKRKAEEQKAQDLQAHRKRQKSRTAFDIGSLPKFSPIVDGLSNGTSKDPSATVKKKKIPIDWWAFEYALAVGRRWRKIVQQRKGEREAFALRRTDVHWGLMQHDTYQAFEKERRAKGKWIESPTTTSGGIPSANVGAEGQTEASEPRVCPPNGERALPGTSNSEIRPSWKARVNRDVLSEKKKEEYSAKVRTNLRDRLGEEGYFSYQLLGECYIHGMMDGEAMLYQNQGDEDVIPSMVFEIR
ncbi:HET-domain-containing protein [Cucurbitaria berberidis CBS 394.84]|uniref:HET-domain-containing protein n=1 Tax=Cucurbitaria berberidis CBS 394.84 TaxID=1168544 RepID=A0A9P4GLG7_9PLEO|nr:HET-domain-containing protein [Cucurbitaria berberidis CBS 394.84]KAF1847634.1 HET-domain-containing protein [Cucurbitaria berberidis CBS 394.84]